MKKLIWYYLVSMFILCLITLDGAQEKKINPSNFPSATPESQGISANSLDKLKNIVKGYYTDGQIVGAELLIIKNRHTVLHETFGWLDREAKKIMSKNTLFNIRSMTKPLTGAGIQLLIDQGKLKPSDPISKYLKGFKNKKSRYITIEQVLSHRSGLPLTIMTSMEDMKKYKTLKSIAEAVGKTGPQFSSGNKFWYSDAGADVLGAVIEVVSGESLEKFIYKNLLNPMGMKDTLYNTLKTPIESKRIASLYGGTSGNWKKFWDYNNEPFYPFAMGSQTLFSTPQDYARFLKMLMDKGKFAQKQILSEKAINRILTPLSRMKTMGTNIFMPTGFFQMEVYYGQMATIYIDAKNKNEPVIIGHSGSDGTWAWAWPKDDLIILYFTQSRGQETGIRLERYIDELLIRPEIVRKTMIPEKYKPFIGKYIAKNLSMGNTIYTVMVQNNCLAVDIPGKMILELKEPDKEEIRIIKMSPNAGLRFIKNSTGKVSEMELIQTTRVPKGIEKVEIPENCPEKFKYLLGKYTIMRLIFSVTWQKNTLGITISGHEPKLLRGPDKRGSWFIVKDPSKKIIFEINTEGKVKYLSIIKSYKFIKEGEINGIDKYPKK